MDSFTPKEWNKLIKDLNNKESKRTLQKVNRDKLFQLLVKTAINKPELVEYGFKHFPDMF